MGPIQVKAQQQPTEPIVSDCPTTISLLLSVCLPNCLCLALSTVDLIALDGRIELKCSALLRLCQSYAHVSMTASVLYYRGRPAVNTPTQESTDESEGGPPPPPFAGLAVMVTHTRERADTSAWGTGWCQPVKEAPWNK